MHRIIVDTKFHRNPQLRLRIAIYANISNAQISAENKSSKFKISLNDQLTYDFGDANNLQYECARKV